MECNRDRILGQRFLKMNNDFTHVKNHLLNSKMIAYPTDTVCGLGVIATDNLAVDNLIQFKGRSVQKGINVLVTDIQMANSLAFIDSKIEKFLEVVWPGAVSVVVKARPIVPESIHGGTHFVGLRVSNHSMLQDFLWDLSLPLTTTSLNLSGDPPAIDLNQVNWLPNEILKLNIQPSIGSGQPSTVVKYDKDQISILREGVVSKSVLQKVAKSCSLSII